MFPIVTLMALWLLEDIYNKLIWVFILAVESMI
jgi:hypothetical protein